MDALRKAYSQDETDPLEPFPGVRTFLNDLQEDSAPSLSAEEALDYLLEAAIDRFGYSARDVFTAVFDLLSTTDRHQQAFKISFAELEDALAVGRVTQLSHQILTLSPVYPAPYMNVKWKVEFKSQSTYWRYLGKPKTPKFADKPPFCIPEAKGLAGYFLEPFAYRKLSQTLAPFQHGL